MDSDKYLEGQSMQRPPLFESDSFIYWKNRFETYVKSKDLDLWHVITDGDFQPIVQNLETKLDEVIPFEKQTDDLKKRLTRNNEAKMVIYNALPRKEYERILCVTRQKKFGKLYESIDSAFARFNIIITSLKALDEGYSSKNYVKKFLRDLHPKWRSKVTVIEESKDLTSLSLDELIGNLKAKKESSDEECSTSSSEDEEYAMASDRKCFRCCDLNHLIRECLKPHKDKNQRAFVGGSWSDSSEEDDEKVKNKTCLVAQASSEIFLGVDLELDEWIKDNGCSKHMTGNRKLFSTYNAYNGGNVIFGSNIRGNIIAKGYSQNSKACIILNKHTKKIKISLNVTFDETPPPSKTSPLVDDDLDKEEAIRATKKKNLENVVEDETLEIDEIVNVKESRNHPLENFIGNLNQRTLRSQAQNQSNFFCFISTIEPKNMIIIGTKWVFRNKLDENGVVSQNKARLVAQGYNQQEGIDYEETYALVARIESIRILLAYAYALDFKLFQMDVKSVFLNSLINEEVYVAQPPGFIDFEKTGHVYKLKKALYGLKQAPKSWYDRVKAFLVKHEYKMGMVDNTLFTKKKSLNLIIVQIYVDDIIFGSTCQYMCDEFAKIMHDEFEMSMMGELNFFHGLQIKQMECGIFFNQSKYIKEMLKKFGLEDSKPMKTPMSSDTKLRQKADIMFSVCLCAASKRIPKSLTLKRLSVSSDTLKGACVFTDKWSLDELAYGVPSDGPYLTNPPSPGDIILTIRIDREGQVRRIRHEEEINVHEYQILTREILSTLKPLEKII
ncbi:retrovirus-related pol polyprotein from transposon TNT 1-94 [Tanacetum coccineum]